MSRVLTFSTVYPSYHPKAGHPTYFVEKIVGGLVANAVEGCGTELIKSLRDSGLLSIGVLNELCNGTYSDYKHHTIRAGHRWKVGDWFSPRVWAGAPYRSKQIAIGPDMQIKKLWDFSIILHTVCIGDYIVAEGEDPKQGNLRRLAENDGLTVPDFLAWFRFPKAFDGQIISWSDKIEY